MKILDVKSNKLVESDEGIERKVASGEYAFENNAEIPVISPDGERGRIPAKDAAKAFEQGFKYVTKKQINQEATQKEYGEGIGAEATAGALGVARGVTFGLSDQALTRLGAMKPGH